MSETTIESLGLEITSNFKSAENGLDELSKTLSKLKSVTMGVSEAASAIDGAAAGNIGKLAEGLQKLKALEGFKISSSIGNQLSSIANAVNEISIVGLENLADLSGSLESLGNLGKASGLQSFNTQLKKLPEIADTLEKMNWDKFTGQINKLSASLTPLANQCNVVAAAFSRLPQNITRVATATNTVTRANHRASTSYINLWAKLHMATSAVRGIGTMISSWIKQSNDYVESVNLFTASMGKYADSAREYAERIGELMGIDPGEWMRNQGVFMTITEGFGVVSDRAYTMSQQLTQLGYDLSSFFNGSVETAMQKLQSGISGELEPLRRWGFDLSQARLQAIALSLGIDKTFTSMTQAEKAQLRYYAIMTQVTTAHGDMARTLNSPANQIRVFTSQLTQCARALGNIFIPAMNAVLPYAIALTKVLRILANTIATLIGFEFPEVDYSGISSGAGSIADDFDDATEAANKFKATILGIDEINRMNGNDSSSGVDNSLGAGFDFELPTYDFLEGAVESRVAQIVDEMKEWLGITEDINSWADLFDTRLGKILEVVGAIGVAFAAWKITVGFMNAIDTVLRLKDLFKDEKWLAGFKKEVGITLLIVGGAIEFSGAFELGKGNVNWQNILKAALGSALLVGGSLLTFGTGPAGWAIGITAALTVGIVAYFKGKERKLQEQYENSEGYKELKEVREKLQEDWEVIKKIKLKIESHDDEYNAIVDDFAAKRRFIEDAFDLSDIVDKTPEQIELLKGYIDTINGWKLEGLELHFDEATKKIAETRDTILEVVQVLERQAKAEAIHDILVELYKEQAEAQRKLDDIRGRRGLQIDKYFEKQADYNRLLEERVKIVQQINENFVLPEEGMISWEEFDSINEKLHESLDIVNADLKIMEKDNRVLGNVIIQDLTKPEKEAIAALEEANKKLEYFKEEELKVIGATSDLADELGKLPSAANNTANGIKTAVSPLYDLFDGLLQKISKIPEELSVLERYPQMFSGMAASSTSRSHSIGGVTIPQFADGGLPTTGQLFIAREAGAELVGNVGGRTAVMNNDQIVESVSQGVADANAEQNVLLREQNALLRQILAKDSSSGAGYPSASDIVNGISRKNRRAGKTVVPVGV